VQYTCYPPGPNIAPANVRVFATALLVFAELSGCAANSQKALPKYQPPPAGEPAAVVDVGKHGHAWLVDGTVTPSFAQTLRLTPGEHRVGINRLLKKRTIGASTRS
jgi:hypothetical protein